MQGNGLDSSDRRCVRAPCLVVCGSGSQNAPLTNEPSGCVEACSGGVTGRRMDVKLTSSEVLPWTEARPPPSSSWFIIGLRNGYLEFCMMYWEKKAMFLEILRSQRPLAKDKFHASECKSAMSPFASRGFPGKIKISLNIPTYRFSTLLRTPS